MLDDAFTMVEHGKMSLPEALRIGLSFVKMYRKSPSFDRVSKNLESERIYRLGVIERLEGIIQVGQARR